MKSSTQHKSGRALVLGGGGSTGNAWLIGVIAGLFDAGLDVTAADLTVGTSAGSTAAAQLAGATPTDLFAAILAVTPPPTSSTGPRQPRAPIGSMADQMERLSRTIAASKDLPDYRRRMGATAIDMALASGDAAQARWRATVADRLPHQSWPERAISITAVDAHTGEPVVFDRESGVDLVDAVAASCAGGFAYSIGSHQYIDGGYRSNADNADLAAGYARVLVLSPLGGRSLHPASWGTHLAGQVDELRARGTVVETVFPDGDSLTAFGENMMDLSTRPPAAQAGYNQGKTLTAKLTALWY